MVDYTEPICLQIDFSLAQILTFDTSGIEFYVTEHNPKNLYSLIRNLKSYYQDNPDVASYKIAYRLMPSQAASCLKEKQQYINEHFCYDDKFAIITNGPGIIRHIAFWDATCLNPVLSDFFSLHSAFHSDTFLGDSSFDTIETYEMLLNDFHFSRILIPYNQRNKCSLKKSRLQ